MEEENTKKELEKMYLKMLENFPMEGTELEKTYLRTLENFPEIKKGDIKIKYLKSTDYALMLMVDPLKFVYENKVVVDPMIIICDKFLESDEQEKEAMLAHELGHYSRYKKRGQSINKIRQNVNRNMLVKSYNNPSIQAFITLDPKMAYKVKRLQKWNMLQELYADKRATEAGYGKVLINVLTRHLKEYNMFFAPVQRDEMTIRIKNLEEKLR
jgi:hypothetical protein